MFLVGKGGSKSGGRPCYTHEPYVDGVFTTSSLTLFADIHLTDGERASTEKAPPLLSYLG